ncbi:hypothetical protein JCM10908_002070 [Rhodotorula pacifica]|uniref:uncharacterized protein n=1 Tax=Rhodotorula pacifica TaxID=1495444 RepID=UPI00317F03DB
MVFRLSAFVAFVTLFQLCSALQGPFFPVRHDHGSRRSALPSQRDLLRARQAVAPSPTFATELLAQRSDEMIVRRLRTLERSLTDAGEEVARRAELVKRAATSSGDGADREYLGEMLHDALYSVFSIVSANAQNHAVPSRLAAIERPTAARAVPSGAPSPSASSKARPKRMTALQERPVEPVYELERTLSALTHITEPVRQVLPTLPPLQREAIQAVLDELHDEAALLAQGILEGRQYSLEENLAMQNIAAQSSELLALISGASISLDPYAAGSALP